ncbi:MAG TPA: hypothetical protein VE196_07765, partial [Pseudonocardiaceae bacterium]|nr:hypothetical protein [Pseudonocardiaceae bacterium]
MEYYQDQTSGGGAYRDRRNANNPANGGSGSGGGAGGGLPGLGDTRDPLQLIPGDVAQLDELAHVLTLDSRISDRLGDTIHAVRDGDWSGAAATGFHKRIAVMVRVLRADSDHCGALAKAVRAFLSGIVTARATAREAIASMAAADRLTEQARDIENQGGSVPAELHASIQSYQGAAMGFLGDAHGIYTQTKSDLTGAVIRARTKFTDTIRGIPDHHPGQLAPHTPGSAHPTRLALRAAPPTSGTRPSAAASVPGWKHQDDPPPAAVAPTEWAPLTEWTPLVERPCPPEQPPAPRRALPRPPYAKALRPPRPPATPQPPYRKHLPPPRPP